MSYWSNNPELYDQIIVDEAIARGIVSEELREEKTDGDIVYDILIKREDFSEIALAAEGDYWGGRIDDAMMKGGDR